WQQVKRNARVVLAVDVSGSMNEQNKIGAARDGAQAFASALGDRDEGALLTVNSRVAWGLAQTPGAPARPPLLRLIRAPFPDGGTALYDAVHQAYESFNKSPEPSRIAAIVVLSDGADRDSSITLEALLKQIRFDSEGRSVRVFTIGYGSDARAQELQAIAEATQGRYYEGKPENIREVFKQISTFF